MIPRAPRVEGDLAAPLPWKLLVRMECELGDGAHDDLRVRLAGGAAGGARLQELEGGRPAAGGSSVAAGALLDHEVEGIRQGREAGLSRAFELEGHAAQVVREGERPRRMALADEAGR